MGALLAWRWVAAEVGGVGRGVKAALGDAWTRSDAALAAGPLSPALPARVSGGALSEPQVREAAPGMGGREWPQRPLLCIIVTQAISCLEVWEKEKKKKPKVGAGELGSGEPESGVPEGTGVHRGCHLLPRDPEGARCASPDKETQFIATLGCREGRRGSTQWWDTGCGRRNRLVTPASAPTDLPLPFSAKLS